MRKATRVLAVGVCLFGLSGAWVALHADATEGLGDAKVGMVWASGWAAETPEHPSLGGHPIHLIDGDATTSWVPNENDRDPWVFIFLDLPVRVTEIEIQAAQTGEGWPTGAALEVTVNGGEVRVPIGSDGSARITFDAPESLSHLAVRGVAQTRQSAARGIAEIRLRLEGEEYGVDLSDAVMRDAERKTIIRDHTPGAADHGWKFVELTWDHRGQVRVVTLYQTRLIVATPLLQPETGAAAQQITQTFYFTALPEGEGRSYSYEVDLRGRYADPFNLYYSGGRLDRESANYISYGTDNRLAETYSVQQDGFIVLVGDQYVRFTCTDGFLSWRVGVLNERRRMVDHRVYEFEIGEYPDATVHMMEQSAEGELVPTPLSIEVDVNTFGETRYTYGDPNGGVVSSYAIVRADRPIHPEMNVANYWGAGKHVPWVVGPVFFATPQ